MHSVHSYRTHLDYSSEYEEALGILAALEGHDATTEPPTVITQYNIIKGILDHEHMNRYTWRQLLRGKGPSSVLRCMVLGAWIRIMNQIFDINVTSYYMMCAMAVFYGVSFKANYLYGLLMFAQNQFPGDANEKDNPGNGKQLNL